MSSDAEAAVQELFFTPEGRMDPYPRYHRLRAAAPVHRSGPLDAWLLTRYEDCWAVLRDPRFGKDYPRQMASLVGADWRRFTSLVAFGRSLLNVDGPAHTRLRRLVAKAFNPRTIDALRPSIERTISALLDPLAEAGGGDILDAVGFPLPVAVIGEMLGVPEAERAQFRQLVRDGSAIVEVQPTPAQLERADAANLTMQRYFHALIDEKRRRPRSDLLSALLLADDDGERLTDDELVAMAQTLFGAGFETTTSLIGNGLFALLRHSDQMRLLRTKPSWVANLADELLRYDGVAQMAPRATLAAVDVGGVEIPAGEAVLVLLGAGNRDPGRFVEPDRLDVTRPDLVPLSFGGGIHYCLGAALAKTEIEIVFRALLDRFETIELAGAPQFRDRLSLRSLHALEVSCRPKAARSAADVDAVWASLAPPARSRVAAAERAVLGLRPRGGQVDDAGWRDALRARVESEAAAAPRTAAEVAASAALLARTPLFRHCTPGELEELAATAYPITFEAGDVVCAEGGVALECYVIAEGEAGVTIAGEEVATVGEDDVVGERGPLENRARSATVVAKTHLITYAISRERLLALVARSPAAAAGMFEYLRRRYRD